MSSWRRVQKKTPTREVLAKVIIPALSPLTVCSGLNLNQFHSIMRTMNLATAELTRIQNKRLGNREQIDNVVDTIEPISINPEKTENISPVATRNLPLMNQLNISANKHVFTPNNILTPKNQFSLTDELIKNSTPIKPRSSSNIQVFTGFQTSSNLQNSNTPNLNNLMQSTSTNSSDLLDFLK